MSSAGLRRPRITAGDVRKGLWILFGVASVIVSSLAVASAANYASIVQAHATVYVVPQFAPSYEGLDALGRLPPNGFVTVLLTAVVENPSDRTLRLQTFAYSGWVQDGPAEAGLNESRRISDDLFIDPLGNEKRFFRLFGESSEVSRDPVLPRANRTFTFGLTISAGTDATRFAVLRNITDFAVDAGGSATSVSWNHYLFLVFTIDGVPEVTSPTAPAHLRNIRRIEREMGTNIGR